MKIPRVLRLLPPIALGVAAAAWFISHAEPPARVDDAGRSIAARTMIASAEPVRTVVRGYGNVQAARSWEAVSEVAGTIVWRHPDLETGNMLEEGTAALKIDPSAYELAVAQAEADLSTLQADVAQIAIDETNTRRLLALEQNRLDLAESELNRIRDLRERGVAAQSALDSQERATLTVRRAVGELQNTLALIPSRRHRLDAQMARTTAILARARRDLEMTEITVPFDLRIGKVHVERHQFVAAGQPLITADDVGQVEITAQIPVASFRRLLGREATDQPMSPSDLPDRFAGVSVEVTLVSDDQQAWAGRLVRVENALDPQARSVPAVVVVDDPYAGVNPPDRLPLVPNMYVELTLTGPVVATQVTLPDSAVHEGGIVYLRDGAGRLELRRVSVGWLQSGTAIILDGVFPGEEVILDDLVPAVPGMIVVPVGEPK
ncbi:acriflavin resistance protein [Aquicoccus sp. SU-CL01552]